MNRDAVGAERAARNLARISTALSAATEGLAQGERPKAAVVAWDLTHNPVGRAYVLVKMLEPDWDVDLIGPMWTRFGSSLWPPLSGAALDVKSFPANDISDYLPNAMAAAVRTRYDLVICGKSRLPGVHLATMIAEWSDAPLIADLDDNELAFADKTSPEDAEAARTGVMGQLLDEPATLLADESLAYFNARTVVSGPLAERYGGVMVRHARKAGPLPGSAHYQQTRSMARARCGIPDHEVALFFIGTVREHKGVQDIVAALDEIGRDDVRLHIYTTTTDAEVKSYVDKRVTGADHRYVTHGPCSMEELGRIMTGADLVVLAQEAGSAISEYQVPAKISDATAVGCPVLVPRLPVFADFESLGLVHTYAPGELTAKIAAMVDAPLTDAQRRDLQDRFLSELGETVNRGRMNAVAERARQTRMSEPRHASDAMHAAVNELYLASRPPPPAPAAPQWSAVDRPQAYDVAFFWKQNDSEIYGRRSDMIVRTAQASGRVGNAIHFDGALDSTRLHQKINHAPTGLTSEADLVLPNIIERVLKAKDDDDLIRRCFVYDGDDKRVGNPRLFGQVTAGLNGYADFVHAEMAAAGMDPARTLAWLWPVVPGLEHVLAEVNFAAVVCDLVDDQRSWPDLADSYRDYLERSYGTAIEAADLVITNSPANGEAFHSFGKAITVIPNGAEPRPLSVDPVEILGEPLGKPLIGYVGNMRDRVDWDLIEGIATKRPDWSIVLVGEAPAHIEAHAVAARCPNIRLTGILPYHQARSLMTTFDAGIVPHLLTDQSKRMDPLKLYNMVAMGIPVVSTAHPTAVGLSDQVAIGHDVSSFVSCIESALNGDRPDPDSVDISGFAWSKRVATAFTMIDSMPEARACRSAPND